MKEVTKVKRTHFDISKLSEEEIGYLVGFFIGDGYIKKGLLIKVSRSIYHKTSKLEVSV